MAKKVKTARGNKFNRLEEALERLPPSIFYKVTGDQWVAVSLPHPHMTAQAAAQALREIGEAIEERGLPQQAVIMLRIPVKADRRNTVPATGEALDP